MQEASRTSRCDREVRARARQFVEEFNVLLCGKDTQAQHFGGETLLIRIARFLPSTLEMPLLG
jgi:hypothetical protein